MREVDRRSKYDRRVFLKGAATAVPGTPVTGAERWGDRVAIKIAGEQAPRLHDFLIVGTGFNVDLSIVPELAAYSADIASWGDVYKAPEGLERGLHRREQGGRRRLAAHRIDGDVGLVPAARPLQLGERALDRRRGDAVGRRGEQIGVCCCQPNPGIRHVIEHVDAIAGEVCDQNRPGNGCVRWTGGK